MEEALEMCRRADEMSLLDRPGSPGELGCCKEQPHTEVSHKGLPCPPAGADSKVLWRAAGTHSQKQ